MILSPTALLPATAALVVVVALILAAARAARATGLGRRMRTGRRLAVVESAALDPRRRLHLVACDGRHMLLLTGGGSDVALGWLPSAGPEDAQ